MRQKGTKTPPLPCPVALRGISVFITIGNQKLLPAVSRSLTGCLATLNIGEVARSDGGVNPYSQKNL